MLLRKIVGGLLIIAAAAGIVFSLVGLIEVWRYRPVLTKTVIDNLALVDEALNTNQDVLTIVGQTLQSITTDIASLHATTEALAQTAHDTDPMLDSLISMTGKDFPNAISATQTSLASAQNTALIIDNLLAALTSIPFSPLAAYKPAVPLHTALAQVSTSLNSLIPSLATMKTSLTNGKTNLGIIEVELTNISASTQGISVALADAQTAIDQYKADNTQLQTGITAAQRGAPTWMMATAWILSFLFIWILIVNLGIGIQGLDFVQGRPEARSTSDLHQSSQMPK